MESSRIWIFLAFFVVHSLAVPMNNVTLTTYGSTPGLQVAFASEPRGRGTVSILITCTTTLFFCIWTAVHPNIVPGVPSLKRLYYKSILMAISLTIPEAVLICAFSQFLEARRLRQQWNTRYPDAKKKMNLQVAFFVVMGGFVVGVQKDPPPEENRKLKIFRKKIWMFLTCRGERGVPKTKKRPYRAILTPTGFIKYMNQGYIHEQTFDSAAIADKSKTSTFAKALAATQALYMAAGCASRWRSGLPLTLLEVHVLIQVVRTALIYGFWWCKPLDVNEPIIIQLKKVVKPTPGNIASEKISALVSQSSLSSTSVVSPGQEISSAGSFRQRPILDSVANLERLEDEELVFHPLDSKEKLDNEISKNKKYSQIERDFVTKQSPHSFAAFNSLATYDIMSQIDLGEREGREESSQDSSETLNKSLGTIGDNPKATNGALFVGALLVCMTGILHAAAWNSSFPTTAEMWLWRASSLAICCCCLGVFLIANFSGYKDDLTAFVWEVNRTNPSLEGIPKGVWNEVDKVCKEYARRWAKSCDKHLPVSEREGDGRSWVYYLHWLGICTTFFLCVVYSVSASYLIVEAYLSLRNPVPGTFLTPNWTNYWPHL